jgi:type IV pilus assembly protein PilN
MATTTLMPLDPAMSPQRVVRLLTISADLLPEEIVAARRARRARGIVLVSLLAVVAMLAGWFLYANHQVAVADDDLNDVTSQVTLLQRGQSKYQEVVDTQNETSTISKQLTKLLDNDLPWATLLTTLRDTGTQSGVTVAGVIGTLDSTTASTTTSTTLPNASGVTTIGTLTLTGTGPDKPSVAKYVDNLGKLTTVANPYLTSATQTHDTVTFSITLNITSKALCGRFTIKCKSTGGK